MSLQHKELASGRWQKLSFAEQMANIGSEVERALNWKNKGNLDYSQKAFERSLELLDLSIDMIKNLAHLRELTRLREALVDFFFGNNEFSSSDLIWKKYFSDFTFAVRKNY